MWESNPPGRFLAPLTGFEDRGAHQHPATPMGNHHTTRIFKMQAYFTFYRENRSIPETHQIPQISILFGDVDLIKVFYQCLGILPGGVQHIPQLGQSQRIVGFEVFFCRIHNGGVSIPVQTDLGDQHHQFAVGNEAFQNLFEIRALIGGELLQDVLGDGGLDTGGRRSPDGQLP